NIAVPSDTDEFSRQRFLVDAGSFHLYRQHQFHHAYIYRRLAQHVQRRPACGQRAGSTGKRSNSYADPNSNANSHSNGNTIPHSDTNSNPNSNRDSHTNANADSNSDTNTPRNSDTNPDGDTERSVRYFLHPHQC